LKLADCHSRDALQLTPRSAIGSAGSINRSKIQLPTETLLDCLRVFAHGLVGESNEDRNSYNQ
jgi:hypothetical protein